MKKKILITDPVHPEVLQVLKRNFSVEQKTGLSKEELISIVGSYDFIIGRTTTKIDADVLRAAKKLIGIGVHATGWDHIDVSEATKRNIVILGFPPNKKRFKSQLTEGSSIPVAEHVMLGMLAAAGNFYNTVASMKAGRWEKYSFSGTELYGKTVGIIGLGRTGSLVAERAKAFGMRVVAYSPRLTRLEAKKRGALLVPIEKLCREADFITIHVPKTPETVGLLNEKLFSIMKDGVIIANTSRASVIAEPALIDALKKQKVRAAVIDVFEHPPRGVNPELVALSSVLPTPHIAGVSQESLKRVSSRLAKIVSDFLHLGKAQGVINPEVLKNRSKKS
jgi:D-3-phosphoglycerate dehydrogenase / 2-oxoglutarate reductase